MNLKFDPNATNEEKINALEKMKVQTKKKLLILTPISIVASLLYLFFGTALSYTFFGAEISYKFNELSSVDGDTLKALAALSNSMYIPFIIALFAQAASLILIIKFPLDHKANLVTLVINAICAFFAVLILTGSFYCVAGVVALGNKYVTADWMPVVFSLIICFLNALPINMIAMYKINQKKISAINIAAN